MTITGGGQHANSQQVTWSQDALTTHQDILTQQGQALREQAEAVTLSHQGNTVAPSYVNVAAQILSMKYQNPMASVWLAIGPSVATLGGGILLTWWTTPPQVAPPGWAKVAVNAIVIAGVLMTGIAIGQLRRSGAIGP